MTSPHIVARVKEAIDLQALVADYVPMKKSAAQYLIECPWHHDSRPSCRVYHDHLYCFSCNQGGDCFTFLRQIEGISFSEALKQLADRSGIPLDSKPVSRAAMRYAREEAEMCRWWWERRKAAVMAEIHDAIEAADDEILDILAMPLREMEAMGITQRFEVFRASVTERSRQLWREHVAYGKWFEEWWMGLAR